MTVGTSARAARPRVDARWPIGAEPVLFLALMVMYEWLRDFVAVADPVTAPVGHALDVIDSGGQLGAVRRARRADGSHSVPGGEFVTTWIYTLAHTTGFAATPFWMWFLPQGFYDVFRNWFWITNGLAVVGYWLYPLALPRLTDLGLEDPNKGQPSSSVGHSPGSSPSATSSPPCPRCTWATRSCSP